MRFQRSVLVACLASLFLASSVYADSLIVRDLRGQYRLNPKMISVKVGPVRAGHGCRIDDRRTPGVEEARLKWERLAAGDAWIVAQKKNTEPSPDGASRRESGSGGGPTEQDARRLLEGFLDSATDKAALMRSLRPRTEDYQGVYKAPVAAALEKAHKRMWDSGEVIAARPGQTELLVIFATTDDLIDRTRVAKSFPGGYGRIAPYLKRGIPIVRFKFVKPGEALGMAFDGLVYVNKRWAFIPKPWRGVRRKRRRSQ